MPFEFAFLDWLQQFHNPVLDALAVFLNYAGEHGEIWIAFTLLLLLFRRTRKAGCAMATRWYCIWCRGLHPSSRCSPAPVPAT